MTVRELDTAGLPVAGAASFHPSWLAAAAPECVCPLADLMTRGCSCGAMAAERAADRAKAESRRTGW